MKMLSSLNQTELRHLAKTHHIPVTNMMTKEELITILVKKEITSTPKNTISVPTNNIPVYFDNDITVLPQSNESVLIIWNADPSDDVNIKSWKITNRYGLDILLPSYARSLFIHISLLIKLEFSLYKILHNGQQILFKEYFSDFPLLHYNQQDLELLNKMYSNYSHSIQNFSSGNNFNRS